MRTRTRRNAGWDAPSQLEAMDAEGLDAAVLFPSRGLFVLGLDTVEQAGADGYEPELAAAVARAYNDWLHDFCADGPDATLRRRAARTARHRRRRRRGEARVSGPTGSRPCSYTRAA